MTHIATTPFGRRPVTAGLMAAQALARTTPSLPEIDKYSILDDLRDARAVLGVTDRDLAVLAALLSFHPSKMLTDGEALVVYPSNRALSGRAHGMAESTLRRHVAHLVQAGLILRHDSPNGKRFALRSHDGMVQCAYGFSLRPLLVRATEIAETASAARLASEKLRHMRIEVSVALRDAVKLIEYGIETQGDGRWTDLQAQAQSAQRTFRRRLDAPALKALHGAVLAIAHAANQALSPCVNTAETEKVSGRHDHIERQYQNSNKDHSDFELCLEESKAATEEPKPEQGAPTIPLALVCKACPDLELFADTRVDDWHQLVQAADKVRPMLGISPDAWNAAQRAMGPEKAATTVAAILQRAGDIRSPGGYLRSLTRRAEDNAFSPGPMVMALLKAA